ncbi:hypothetical protein BDV97DRAFT_401674 [Delphinella strobiligena]|nr:hypothetical protein BDV97DRAFT_401674 [Delphinella strobiligena]
MEETAASDEQTLNRKRGRPRKSEPPEQQQEQREQREQPSSKRTRARGRPRKSDIQDDAIASADVSTPQSQTTSPAAVVTTMIPPDPVPHDPTLNSTSDIDSIGIPNDLENKKQKQPRPRGRPRKYKTKEEYQEAGKQYRLAHKARKSMLAEGTIRLAPAVNGVGDDDETDEDSGARR